MKIKKIGHCCLVIETKGKRIMTDPGFFTVKEQEKESNIDLILITHEHADHLSIDSLKKILVKNPKAVIITNNGVGKILKDAGIKYEVLKNKTAKDFSGVEIETHDCKHEEIFQDYGQVFNTAFFVDKTLFYPGDSFYNPGKIVEILVLPVAGSWTRIKDAIKYTLEIKPQKCFPVHDGLLNFLGASHEVLNFALSVFNIDFRSFEDKKEEEF